MIVRMHDGLWIVTPEGGGEAELSAWSEAHAGQVFRLEPVSGGSIFLRALGAEDEACRTPLNIHFASPAPLSLMSNFALTPFTLDGRTYASVEAFWQGLKFAGDNDRERIARLHGGEAKRAGIKAPAAESVAYKGRSVRVGTRDHWDLMERACAAKFAQNEAARSALLGTGNRPLEHRLRRDSRTIPGIVMADIWMRLRARL